MTPAGDGRYEAFLDEQWSIAGKLNGGYLLAVAARAALAEAGEGHEHPLATTAAFAAPAPAGPALVVVEPLRLGRGTSVLRARLSSPDGGDGVHRGARHRRADRGRRARRARAARAGPPARGAVPAAARRTRGRSRCRSPGWSPSGWIPPPPASAVARPSGAGELRAWVRFDDGREPDPLALITVADALPPPSFDVPGLQFGWTPTLQYSVFVRAVPAPGPLRVRTVAPEHHRRRHGRDLRRLGRDRPPRRRRAPARRGPAR